MELSKEEMLKRLPLWNAVAQGKTIQRFCFVRLDWYDIGDDCDFALEAFDFPFYWRGKQYLHPYRIKPEDE